MSGTPKIEKKRCMGRCIPQYISPIPIKQITFYIVIERHNKNKTVIISQERGELFVELMFLRWMSQHTIICEVVLFQQRWLGVEDPTKAVVKGVEFQTCWHKPATLNYSSTSCWQAATLFLPTAGLLIGFLPSDNNPLSTALTSGIIGNFSVCKIFLHRNFKGF